MLTYVLRSCYVRPHAPKTHSRGQIMGSREIETMRLHPRVRAAIKAAALKLRSSRGYIVEWLAQDKLPDLEDFRPGEDVGEDNE